MLYLIYLYADGLMQWASAPGTFIASVNYEYHPFSGDPYGFYLPGSQTCSIIHIASRSNVGIPGMFVLQIYNYYLRIGNYYCLFSTVGSSSCR